MGMPASGQPARQKQGGLTMHKFKILDAANGQFRVQFLYNSEIMVWSENYKSKDSAKNCIESIKKNAPGAATVDLTKDEKGSGYRFEMEESKNGETFVRFKASNGETMVRSETYKSKASAKNCIESVKKNGPDAEVIDETGKSA
jgi:uncharacterized protein YegP (UPF0339 family)